MKIATLTFQRHDNYGAMLQCYALQKKLMDLGVETEVIDYISEVSEHPFGKRALKAKGVKRYITGSIGALTRLPRAKSFNDFRKILRMTKTVTGKNISQLGAAYDGYIVGSDNVWNSDITGMDEQYFLSFVADKRRRASYAASFGNSKIKDNQREQYKTLLNEFAILTCREKTGAELIKELIGKDAKMVCDPSILLTSDEWCALAKDMPQKKKYLLVYQMVPSGTFVKFVKEVAASKKLKVIYIPFPYGFIRCDSKPRIGPLEWLGLFKNAEYILTDSFHGCVFSVIFQKQFAVRISQLGERIDNFLTVLNIKNRVVENAEAVSELNNIDYTAVNLLLEDWRTKSLETLKEILSYFESLTSNGINNPSQCTGCLLCKEICPNNAINIKRDALGFIYPQISEDKCVKCNACEEICASIVTEKKSVALESRRYYAAINFNRDIVKKSGSGGTFYALAEAFVKKGGSIYGAAFQTGFKVLHERVDNAESLIRLMGTKYTQSYIAKVYAQIAADLTKDLPVLFVGTPCQCAAVRAYLKRTIISDAKLYVVDIFCHGVFSPQIWQEYIELLEKKFGEKIVYISFRDKDKGWRNKYLKVTTETKDISNFCNNHASVLRIYEQNISLRESCYQCPYMCLERVGDLSIGDFWGIERVAPKLDRNTGVSAVIVNNHKGEWMIENIKDTMMLNEFTEDDILQQVLKEPTKKHSKRNRFIEDYQNGGISSILEKYGQVRGKLKLKRDVVIPLLYKLRLAGLASRVLHMNDN